MKGVKNPVAYDDKVPTNVRLEPSLKSALFEEAVLKETTMSELLNQILKNYFTRVKTK